MKSANVKKIAAVVAGATLLGVGLAFAGSVSFQNIPIISNSGQPVVQIVVGSGAKPSDGVAAANIAAAIGNLAYTSVPVTASVNATQAAKVLGASPSQYSLSNQAVYINSTSVSTGPSGTYSFQALIGSVLNRAVKVGPVSATKYLATYTSGDAYYNTNYNTSASPVFSPYVSSGVPMNTTVSAGTNGGGVTFSSFTNSTGDNLLRVTSTNLASLESNAGTSGESEYLWLTGVPVYNQHSKSLQLMDANGAYQIVFNKYIAANFTPSSGNYMNANNATFSLLGQNYTIIKVITAPSNSVTSTTKAISGGKLQVATALAPASTVYVGKNISAGNFTVELTDLGQPASGISPASLNIYYNGQLEKVTSQSPGLQSYNISGHTLAVDVKSTFAGLYSYQKYANIELYSGIENITNNQVFNQTRNPDWYTKILWMNTTTTQTATSNALPNQLYSIIIYGGTKASANLMPGQSFSFITDPAMYKLSFINSTGVSYDPVSITTTSAGATAYKNAVGSASGSFTAYNALGSQSSVSQTINDTAISEPMQVLSVSSSIPSAFSFGGQNSKSVVYNLLPYELTEYNAVNASNSLISSNGIAVTISNSVNTGNFISKTYPLTVTISGYKDKQLVSHGFIFNSTANAVTENSLFFDNVTNITLSKAVPGILSANVYVYNTLAPSTSNIISNGNVIPSLLVAASSSNALLYASLTPAPIGITYNNGKLYNLTSTSNVLYNQYNGQTPESFVLTSTTGPSTAIQGQYFNYSILEYPVPGSTTAKDVISFGIANSSVGAGASTVFQLNETNTGSASMGTINNLTYTSTQNNKVNAATGFITERGSVISSIGQSALSINLAKSVDYLSFMVGPESVSAVSVAKQYGPFKVGQSLSSMGLPNATVSKITANVSASNVVVTGISNLTATPSVSSADQVVLLKNLSTNPLVVLDNASVNPSSNLVLVGSGYVNALSKQLQSAYNVTDANLNVNSGVVQAYGSNRILVAGYTASQTTAAANQFIEDLYAAAANSQ